MSEEDLKKVFARNLSSLLSLSDKQPADLVRDLKFPYSTVSGWLSGEKFPRPAKLQILAEYFHVNVSDLTKTEDSIPESYYLNEDAKELAEFLFRNPKYKVLFDASRKVKPEDVEFVRQMIDRMCGDID